MRPFLVFQLWGPLASWGETAVGEVRPSESRPARSALLGLFGAALGLRREEEERQRQLAESLLFGVAIDRAGTLLVDYHTTQTLPPRRGRVFSRRADQLAARRDDLVTMLSERHYRCDAMYRVAACRSSAAGPWSLSDLQAALERPVFALYLGRKSCPPGMPLAPRLVEAETFQEALARTELPSWGWSRLLSYRVSREEPILLVWEGDAELGGVAAYQEVERRDEPRSRRQWTFSRRRELWGSLPREDA